MKEKVNNYLKEMVKEGVIKSYYLDKYDYWQGVPYIELNNGRIIALAKTYFYMRNLCLKTIYDYKNMTYIKEKISDIINGNDF